MTPALLIQPKRIVNHAIAVALILMVPLTAMQFTDEVLWTFSDFIIAGALLFGTGLLLDLVLRKTSRHRLAAAAAVTFAFLWLWAELAVGVFTSWGS